MSKHIRIAGLYVVLITAISLAISQASSGTSVQPLSTANVTEAHKLGFQLTSADLNNPSSSFTKFLDWAESHKAQAVNNSAYSSCSVAVTSLTSNWISENAAGNSNCRGAVFWQCSDLLLQEKVQAGYWVDQSASRYDCKSNAGIPGAGDGVIYNSTWVWCANRNQGWRWQRAYERDHYTYEVPGGSGVISKVAQLVHRGCTDIHP